MGLSLFRAFQLTILSDIYFPELPESGAASAESARVSIQFGEVSPAGLASPKVKSLFHQATETEWWLQVPRVARFLVANGTHIIVDRSPGGDDATLRLFLLTSCLSALLTQRGLFLLHGSAVQVKDYAVGFLGLSGAGKSTLSGAFLKRGYSLLTDGICATRFRGAGVARFSAGESLARLGETFGDCHGCPLPVKAVSRKICAAFERSISDSAASAESGICSRSSQQRRNRTHAPERSEKISAVGRSYLRKETLSAKSIALRSLRADRPADARGSRQPAAGRISNRSDRRFDRSRSRKARASRCKINRAGEFFGWPPIRNRETPGFGSCSPTCSTPRRNRWTSTRFLHRRARGRSPVGGGRAPDSIAAHLAHDGRLIACGPRSIAGTPNLSTRPLITSSTTLILSWIMGRRSFRRKVVWGRFISSATLWTSRCSFASHLNCSIDRTIAYMSDEKLGFSKSVHGQASQLRQRLLTWSRHVESWTNVKTFPVLVLRYEDMRRDPLGTFTKGIEFLGLAASRSAVETALENSRLEKLQTYEAEFGFKEKPAGATRFFRKGEVGEWQNTLTAAQRDRIIEDHRDTMQRNGY